MEKYISMDKWLTKERIDELLTTEEIEYITQNYQVVFEDAHFFSSEGEEVELTTRLPFVQDYFFHLMEFVTDDINTLDEYIKQHAKIKLKAQILDASQTFCKIPLWETKDGLQILDKKIDELKEYYNDTTPQHWVYSMFFPIVSKEICLVEKYQIRWAIEVLEEFRDFADHEYLYLSEEERVEAKRKNEEEIRKLTEILSGD